MTTEEAKQTVDRFRLIATEAVREIGVALQYLDQAEECAESGDIMIEQLAEARECFTAAGLSCHAAAAALEEYELTAGD
jgi:hypothetical protein